VYVSPLYTIQWKEWGLTSGQLTLLGVASQAGIGLGQYPCYLLYKWTSTNFKLQKADRIQGVFTSGCVIASTAGVGLVLIYGNASNFPLLVVLMLVYGMGTGATFTHAINVANFNLVKAPGMKRQAIGLMSFSFGWGGLTYALMYYYVVSLFGLSVNFFLLAFVTLLALLPRYLYIVRSKEAIPEVELSEIHGSSQIVPTEERSAFRVVPLTIHDYLLNSIVWLSSITSAFGIGIGASFLAGIGNMSASVTDYEPEYLTFQLTMVFLGVQTGARLATAVVYASYNNPFILAFWQVLQVMGIGCFLFKSNIVTLYASTVLVACGFGGIWAAFPVMVAVSWPGIPQVDYMRSISLAYFFCGSGTIIVVFIQNALLQIGSWSELNPNMYLSAFIYYFISAAFCTALSVYLGLRVSRLY